MLRLFSLSALLAAVAAEDATTAAPAAAATTKAAAEGDAAPAAAAAEGDAAAAAEGDAAQAVAEDGNVVDDNVQEELSKAKESAMKAGLTSNAAMKKCWDDASKLEGEQAMKDWQATSEGKKCFDDITAWQKKFEKEWDTNMKAAVDEEAIFKKAFGDKWDAYKPCWTYEKNDDFESFPETGDTKDCKQLKVDHGQTYMKAKKEYLDAAMKAVKSVETKTAENTKIADDSGALSMLSGSGVALTLLALFF